MHAPTFIVWRWVVVHIVQELLLQGGRPLPHFARLLDLPHF